MVKTFYVHDAENKNKHYLEKELNCGCSDYVASYNVATNILKIDLDVCDLDTLPEWLSAFVRQARAEKESR